MKTLKLDADAFNTELFRLTGPNKVGWSAEEHQSLAEALLTHLKDDEGHPVLLDEQATNLIRLIFRPVDEHQRIVLRQLFTNAGYELDGDTESTFAVLFSATQFAHYLANENNPQTGHKFITADTRRGVKKKKFSALIQKPAPTTAIAAPATEPEVPEPSAQATKTEPNTTK